MANKTVRSFSSRQLREKAKEISSENPMEFNNISKIKLDSFVVSNILTCLESDNYLDLSDGLYFTMGLLQKNKLKDFGDDFSRYLIKRIPELISREQNSQVRSYALQFFVWLRGDYSNYRSTMLSLLNSDDLGQRRCALNNYETYCKKDEIKPLLHFQEDPFVAELAMCGPLLYQFRDIALEKISKLIGKNFTQNKIKEQHPDWGNDYVSWYDWQPFLEWYRRKKKKSIFGQ